MKKWILRIINFLTGSIILSSLHCTLTVLFTEEAGKVFVRSLIYLPVIMILSLAEKRSRYAWQYLLCAIFPITLAYFAGKPGFERNLMIVLMVVAAVSFFISRASGKKCWLDVPVYPYLLVFFAIYLAGMQYDSQMLKNYAMFGAGIYFILCIWHTNLSEIEYLIDMDSSLERFPMRRLLSSNYLMLGIQTTIVSAGMLLSPHLKIDELIYKVGRGLRAILVWLLSWIHFEEVEMIEEEADGQAQMEMMAASETSLLTEILYKLMEILAGIVLVVFVGYIIYRIIKFLYQLYCDFDLHSVENGDQIEQLLTPNKKTEKSKLKKQNFENLFLDRSPNARIRKYYKRRVLKDLKDVPNPSLTPEEIEQGVVMEEDEKKIFHTYYEKARYGKEACTKEEMLKYKF